MNRQFMDQYGLKFLLEQIRAIMEQKLNINTTSVIEEDSTYIPYAGAVYSFVMDALADLTKIKIIKVDVLPDVGETNVWYLVPVPGKPDRYTQHIYMEEYGWIDLGPADIELDNYWSKDELVPMTNADIQDLIDDVFGATAPIVTGP